MEVKTSKERIFEEAANLFREKGYQAASMRELSSRVGLKPSSFYNHIKSKEEILQKICFESANKFMVGMKLIKKEHTEPIEQLKAVIRLHIDIAIKDRSSVTVFNDEWKHLSEPYLSDFLKMRKRYEKEFSKIIEAGIKAKQFRKINPSIALFSILTSLKWIHYWNKPKPKFNVKEIEQDIINLLMNGISNK